MKWKFWKKDKKVSTFNFPAEKKIEQKPEPKPKPIAVDKIMANHFEKTRKPIAIENKSPIMTMTGDEEIKPRVIYPKPIKPKTAKSKTAKPKKSKKSKKV